MALSNFTVSLLPRFRSAHFGAPFPASGSANGMGQGNSRARRTCNAGLRRKRQRCSRVFVCADRTRPCTERVRYEIRRAHGAPCKWISSSQTSLVWALVRGYAEKLEVLADPTHEYHEVALDALGDDHDPDAQPDVDLIHYRLAALAKKWAPRPRKAK